MSIYGVSWTQARRREASLPPYEGGKKGLMHSQHPPRRVFFVQMSIYGASAPELAAPADADPPWPPLTKGGETLGVPRVLSLAAWHSK